MNPVLVVVMSVEKRVVDMVAADAVLGVGLVGVEDIVLREKRSDRCEMSWSVVWTEIQEHEEERENETRYTRRQGGIVRDYELVADDVDHERGDIWAALLPESRSTTNCSPLRLGVSSRLNEVNTGSAYIIAVRAIMLVVCVDRGSSTTNLLPSQSTIGRDHCRQRMCCAARSDVDRPRFMIFLVVQGTLCACPPGFLPLENDMITDRGSGRI